MTPAALDAALESVRSRSTLRPVVGVVLGSGLGGFAERLGVETTIEYRDIAHFPQSTVAGHAGRLLLGAYRGRGVAVLSGRVHAYEGHSFAAVGFPIRVLAGLGVRTVILTNAAGAVNPDFRPGDLMVIRDHINLMGGNPLTAAPAEWGPKFVDLAGAYDAGLSAAAEEAGRAAGVTVRSGVYVAFAGPSYETPAEIRMARLLGGDAVGMSTVPEVIAARQCGLRVAALSCLTNMAAGVAGGPLDHEDVLATAQRSSEGLFQVIGALLERAA